MAKSSTKKTVSKAKTSVRKFRNSKYQGGAQGKSDYAGFGTYGGHRSKHRNFGNTMASGTAKKGYGSSRQPLTNPNYSGDPAAKKYGAGRRGLSRTGRKLAKDPNRLGSGLNAAEQAKPSKLGRAKNVARTKGGDTARKASSSLTKAGMRARAASPRTKGAAIAGGAVVAGAAAYGGYRAYKHFKNDPKSPANARGQVSDIRGNSRVGKKTSQPFYYRTVKGKKQRVRKGKR